MLVPGEEVLKQRGEKQHHKRPPHVWGHKEQHAEADRGVDNHPGVVATKADLHRFEGLLSAAEGVVVQSEVCGERQDGLHDREQEAWKATPNVDDLHEEVVQHERHDAGHDDAHGEADEEGARHHHEVDALRERPLDTDSEQGLQGHEDLGPDTLVVPRKYHERVREYVEERVDEEQDGVPAEHSHVDGILPMKAQAERGHVDLQADEHIDVAEDHAGNLHFGAPGNGTCLGVRPDNEVGKRQNDEELHHGNDRQGLHCRELRVALHVLLRHRHVPPVDGRRLAEDLSDLHLAIIARTTRKLLHHRIRHSQDPIAICGGMKHHEDVARGPQLILRVLREPPPCLVLVRLLLYKHVFESARGRVLPADRGVRKFVVDRLIRRHRHALHFCLHVHIHVLDQPLDHRVNLGHTFL
mmetsp:Transcript_67674/g.195605  ORF Transcript_67674/g.195605 Transcript_67674/m.195605 type:complete len:412 (-) Transcript_67674:12-1247(-)